jgi:hypothetical protein
MHGSALGGGALDLLPTQSPPVTQLLLLLLHRIGNIHSLGQIANLVHVARRGSLESME